MYKPTLGERFGYLRFIDNWHKFPPLSRLMCRLGRHDFETESVGEDHAVLRCFYCEAGRRSWLMRPSGGAADKEPG